MRAVLDRPLCLEVVSRRLWPQSEEEMYVAIARAWCRMGSHEEHCAHPLGPYVLAPGFAQSVARAPVEGLLVASVCARLASVYPWRGDTGESPSQQRWAPFDPLTAWWHAIEDPHGLGVHYGELTDGTLQFLFVGGLEQWPGWEEPPGWGLACE